jgi:hypothetical protein
LEFGIFFAYTVDLGAERLGFCATIVPAIRCNLFIFKGKIKRIFTSNEVH